MFKTYQVLSLFGFVALAATLVGCSKEQAPAPPAVVEEEVVEQVEVPELSPSDVTDAMAALSETDRAAALAQKVCPVSGETLGGMGTPIKVTVKGRDVFLCCEGCREKLEANPDEYLAKLDAQTP
jgi:YHS domain-containing protein